MSDPIESFKGRASSRAYAGIVISWCAINWKLALVVVFGVAQGDRVGAVSELFLGYKKLDLLLDLFLAPILLGMVWSCLVVYLDSLVESFAIKRNLSNRVQKDEADLRYSDSVIDAQGVRGLMTNISILVRGRSTDLAREMDQLNRNLQSNDIQEAKRRIVVVTGIITDLTAIPNEIDKFSHWNRFNRIPSLDNLKFQSRYYIKRLNSFRAKKS